MKHDTEIEDPKKRYSNILKRYIGLFLISRNSLFFMLNRLLIPVFLMVVTASTVTAQQNPYDGFGTFISGMGARNVGLSEANGAELHGDIDSWSVNPANFSPSSWANATVHSSFFPGDIRSYALQGVVSRDSVWPVVVGLSRTSFGQNLRFDVEGNAGGEFNAFVTGLDIATRRKLSESFSIGLGLNYDWRTIDFYDSHLLHFTIGGIYSTNEKNSFGLTISHLGYEIVPFESDRHSLPLDVSAYWRRSLDHLPFTFFLRMQKLNLWNRMEYQNPFLDGDQNINQDPPRESRIRDLANELLRHMVIGGEFQFGQPGNVWLRFSYDHWRNQQLGIPAIRSLEGVAVGFGLKIKVFRLDYTWDRLYFDSGSHQVSLSFRLFEKSRREKGF